MEGWGRLAPIAIESGDSGHRRRCPGGEGSSRVGTVLDLEEDLKHLKGLEGGLVAAGIRSIEDRVVEGRCRRGKNPRALVRLA